MGFWQSVGKFFKIGQGPNSPSTSLTGPGSVLGGMGTIGNTGHLQMMMRNEEVFSVITRLANTLASLPVHEYKQYEEVTDQISDLLRNEANPSMTSFQLFSQLETSRNLDGNAYAFIERDAKGQPIGLYPIRPSSVIVMRNIDDDSIWYRVSSDDMNFTVYNTEIIHIKHISPLREVLGVSPLDVLRGTLRFDDSVRDFSLSEMDKRDQYIIKYDRNVSPEKRQAMINDFVKMIKENGGAVVQEKGFEYERFQSNFQSSDLTSSYGITKTKIANAFNIPISFLNDTGGKSTRTVEQEMTEFVQMTLLPIVKQYESEINRKLLTLDQRQAGCYFKFNLNGLLRGDTAARTNFYQMMIRNGIATPNDLRKLEELPPSSEPNADVLHITGDLYPLSLTAEERNPTVSTTLSAKGGENEDDEESDNNAKVADNQTTN